MEQQEFEEKMEKGEIKEVKEEELEKELAREERPRTDAVLDDYLPFLETLRRTKQHRTTAPTHTPKSFLEQIEFYDTGGVRRLYLYINGAWRYILLT